MEPVYSTGFQTLDREVKGVQLALSGKMPTWLTGTLLRNGPAKFEAGNQKLRHWFDGFAMLHKFSFGAGRVSYSNRFIEGWSYRQARAKGRLVSREFDTDPANSFLNRVAAWLHPRTTDNTNVNITQFDHALVALTETTNLLQIDPNTLKTTGPFIFQDEISGQITTAHPHFDFKRQAAYNLVINLSRVSTYQIYQLPTGTRARTLVAALPANEPAYFHSFALTENYIILTEAPFVVNPLRLKFGGQPYIENYRWKPEKGTRFVVISKLDGTIKDPYYTPAFFTFHHINAFEQGQDIIIDIAAYEDASIIEELRLDRLTSSGDRVLPFCEVRRYRITGSEPQVDYEPLSEYALDLPRLNYRAFNSQDYNYIYGVSSGKRGENRFWDQLIKLDISQRTNKTWSEPACFPGEPVFVAAPEAVGEDDGVLLSVVLDSRKGASFLLILDAKSFSELGRAEIPHHVPFGFHGYYYN